MGPASLKGGRSKAVALCMVLLLTFIGISSVLFSSEQHRSTPATTGYEIGSTTYNEDFKDGSSSVPLLITASSSSFGPGGMSFSVDGLGSGIVIEQVVRMDLAAVSLDISDVTKGKGYAIKVSFHIMSGPDQYLVTAMQTAHSVEVECLYIVQGTSGTVYEDMFYDARGTLNILVGLDGGKLTLGINGISGDMEVPTSSFNDPSLERLEVVGGTGATHGFVTIGSFQAGHTSHYRYVDILHKTMVPDGKDFCIALHIHADRAYPQMFEIMAKEAEQHGIYGTYDAWYFSHPNQYGTDDPVFRDALKELNDAGWDIGIHAGGAMNLPREKVISAIENITAEFGPIRTWSDHSFRQQDICENGTTIGSIYYVEDLIKDIGAGWCHEWHSASSYYDLNIDGMNYSRAEYEGVPLYRVSSGQALEFFLEPGRQEDVGSWLRSWADERSVFVNHDYFPYFFYVTNGTGSYSILPEHEGISQFPWSDMNPRKVFLDGEWHPLPSFERFLNWTDGYNVWSATVRDVYDRSCLVQQLEVIENETHVTIKNPTGSAIEGMTLFTKSMPTYDLVGGGRTVEAGKGTGNSWHFVFDVMPFETIIFEKEEQGPFDLNDHIPSKFSTSSMIAAITKKN